MTHLMSRANNLWSNESGQGLVEYALILAFIAIVAITLLRAIGTDIQTPLNAVTNAL